jgi:phage shock protein PspC (stress-responsive transcriptional regulator)
MGRRSSWQFVQHERERQEAKQMNPVWRGVGFLLVIGIGVLGYLFANWFLEQNSINGWIFLPRAVINPNIPLVGDLLAGGNLIRIVVALTFLLFSFAFVNFLYAIFFPVKPGEYDLPTPKRQRNRRR